MSLAEERLTSGNGPTTLHFFQGNFVQGIAERHCSCRRFEVTYRIRELASQMRNHIYQKGGTWDLNLSLVVRVVIWGSKHSTLIRFLFQEFSLLLRKI